MEVSVIIPIYNSEKYLRRCIDSVLNQMFGDYEILLIDDGSTDCSSEICEKYSEKSSKIKVIHKPNGGVSSACNLGIDNSRGKYLMFCDSDDYVEPDWIETMYQYAEKNPDSFVFSAFFKDGIDKSGTVRLDTSSPYKHFDSGEYYYMYTHGFSAYRWNRMVFRHIAGTAFISGIKSRAESALMKISVLARMLYSILNTKKAVTVFCTWTNRCIIGLITATTVFHGHTTQSITTILKRFIFHVSVLLLKRICRTFVQAI